MALRSRTDVSWSMLSAVAPFLAGVHVALVVAWVADTIQRAQLLAAQVAQEALAVLLLVLVDLEAAAASTVASAVEVEAVEALAANEASVEGVEEEVSVAAAEVAVVMVEDEEASGTNRTAMDPPTVLRLVLVVLEVVVALAATEEMVVVMEVTAAVDDTRTDAGVTTGDPAVLTMNRSAAEIDTATATVMVGMVEAETMVRGSVHTTATATTIHAHDEDIKPRPTAKLSCQGFVKKKGYLPFSSPQPFSSMRVRSILFSS